MELWLPPLSRSCHKASSSSKKVIRGDSAGLDLAQVAIFGKIDPPNAPKTPLDDKSAWGEITEPPSVVSLSGAPCVSKRGTRRRLAWITFQWTFYRAMRARPAYLNAFVLLSEDFFARQNRRRNALLVDVVPPANLGHFA
uniref:Uncharacterized protein n=1 Tax=Ananas comosus var. bracteatus TaxID=296719 RepID=A0A6V7PU37_ANACO|nr:unnamed protein product [Ananas comosus var. bracteatus]